MTGVLIFVLGMIAGAALMLVVICLAIGKRDRQVNVYYADISTDEDVERR